MLQRVYPAGYVFLDLAGTAPAASGTVYFYEHNTSNLQTVYSDTVGTESANPLTLGADGRLPNDVYVNGKARVRLREYNVVPNNGTLVFTKNDQPNTEQNPYYASNFGCVLDGTTDDYDNLQLAITAAANSILIIDGPIKLSDNVTVPATVWIIAQGTITMASNKTFTAYLITHEAEGWSSGFNNQYDMRAFCTYTTSSGYVTAPSITSQFATAVAAAVGKALYFRRGIYTFLTEPDTITTSVKLIGDGMSYTTLQGDYAASTNVKGFIHFKGNGTNGAGIRDMFIGPGASHSLGAVVKIEANTNEPSGYYDITNVVISYGSNTSGYYYALYLDGSANTSGGQGQRDVNLTNVYLFTPPVTGLESLYANNLVNSSGVNIFAGDVIFTGASATAATQSKNCSFDFKAAADITCDYATYIKVSGAVDTVNFTANSGGCSFHGTTANATAANYTLAGILNVIDTPRFKARGFGAVIANGATSVVITHGMAITPSAGQIQLTSTNLTSNDYGYLYIDTCTSTQFTVHCKADPGASTLIFDWVADCTRGPT